MNGIFKLWGSGNGVLKAAQPHIRILSGFFVLCSILLIPLQTICGVSFLSFISLLWIVLAAAPLLLHFRLAAAALILFTPYLILTPWMSTGPSSPSLMLEKVFQTGRIVLRSTCTLFVMASTMANLPIQELTLGLTHLPIPRFISILIIQLAMQTLFLSEETKRIIDVIRLRGATSGKHGLKVIFSFPVVWMVRILFRAERTAAAMTVRSYGVETSKKVLPLRLTIADMIILISALSVLTLSAFLFLKGIL